jgi:hypothetical protein
MHIRGSEEANAGACNVLLRAVSGSKQEMGAKALETLEL